MAGEFMRIEMLPALHGDCLLLEYGDAKKTRRLLIDGGPIGAWPALEARLASLPAGDRRFELMLMSHVDTDHVEGLVRLLAMPQPWPFVVDQVWFNGWRHLEPAHGLLGGRQGEFFSALLARRLPQQWNRAFGGAAVVVPDSGPLPSVALAGGLTLTLLSPSPAKLAKLREAWRQDLGDAITPGDLDAAWKLLGKQKKYLPGQGLLGSSPALDALLARQFAPDAAAANGSSIAVLAEFAAGTVQKSCLLLADAHADVVIASLQRLLKTRRRKRLKVDAVKVSHHGSDANTSAGLLALLDSPRFLFSSNGAYFRHPDPATIARVIDTTGPRRPTLVFNYRTEFNAMWEDARQQKTLRYKTLYNPDETRAVVLKL